MEHVDMLREEWAKHCGKNYRKHQAEIQSLTKEIQSIGFEMDLCIQRHEYSAADLLQQMLEPKQKELKNYSPRDFRSYAESEFAKDYKTIVGSAGCRACDRMFFKIYFYREYLGYKVNDIQRILKIEHHTYYKAYQEGLKNFFPGDTLDDLSEVG